MQTTSQLIILSFRDIFEKYIYYAKQLELIQLLELSCKTWDLVANDVQNLSQIAYSQTLEHIFNEGYHYWSFQLSTGLSSTHCL